MFSREIPILDSTLFDVVFNVDALSRGKDAGSVGNGAVAASGLDYISKS